MKYVKNVGIYLSFLWLLVLNFSFVNLFMTIDTNDVESVALASTIALFMWGVEYFAIKLFFMKIYLPANEAS